MRVILVIYKKLRMKDAVNAILNTKSKIVSAIFTNRCHHALIALSDCLKTIVTRCYMMVSWMGRKELNQFSSTFLE